MAIIYDHDIGKYVPESKKLSNASGRRGKDLTVIKSIEDMNVYTRELNYPEYRALIHLFDRTHNRRAIAEACLKSVEPLAADMVRLGVLQLLVPNQYCFINSSEYIYRDMETVDAFVEQPQYIKRKHEPDPLKSFIKDIREDTKLSEVVQRPQPVKELKTKLRSKFMGFFNVNGTKLLRFDYILDVEKEDQKPDNLTKIEKAKAAIDIQADIVDKRLKQLDVKEIDSFKNKDALVKLLTFSQTMTDKNLAESLTKLQDMVKNKSDLEHEVTGKVRFKILYQDPIKNDIVTYYSDWMNNGTEAEEFMGKFSQVRIDLKKSRNYRIYSTRFP